MPVADLPDADDDAERALRDALRALMGPLATLCVARGLPFAAAEQLLKQAFVHAADQAHPAVLPHRKVSRISTVTGINRREVTRLVQSGRHDAGPARTPAAELFARWVTDRSYCQPDGQPKVLPRIGPAPSFESLAQAVTRDVHPRSLLDELLRLELARLDDDDRVSLVRDAFVPRGDLVRMLGFVGDNVGDHLSSAVHNALRNDRRHLEQAMFADGVPQAALPELGERVRRHWQDLVGALVPHLQSLVDTAATADDACRVRIGLYSFDDATDIVPAPSPARRARRTRDRS